MLGISAVFTLGMAHMHGLSSLLMFKGDDFTWLLVAWWGFCCVAFGRIGALYSFSAFVQQVAILAISAVLLPRVGVWGVILMVSSLYIWAHGWGGWTWAKFAVAATWGGLMVVIYATYQSLWLNVLLHNMGGMVGIYTGVLLAQPQWKAWFRAHGITLPTYKTTKAGE
jgi:hypothetical protein